MNMIALESGAGTALSHAPLVGGDANLVALVQHVAGASNATSRFVFPAGTLPSAPARGADNPLGWPGLWPTAHVFASFDPTIAPTGDIDLGCAITSDDSGGGILSGDYECDATSLHLPARTAQAEMSITPTSGRASTSRAASACAACSGTSSTRSTSWAACARASSAT